MCVLAMYDVRGIQAYIFRTNKVKDIIGASRLVEDIIRNAFTASAAEVFAGRAGIVITEWEKEEGGEIRFFQDNANETVLAQILLIGGGNAYILYRSETDCVEVNKRMARYILDVTYSLQLAVSKVSVTGNYFEDYLNVSAKIGDVKASMPWSKPLGALPVTAVDDVTGYPLTSKADSGELISTESERKRRHLPREDKDSKQFDNLITEKGEESLLAIVHIDGNSMGDMIRTAMQSLSETDRASYSRSIAVMREISLSIKNSFEGTYRAMEEYLSDWLKSDRNKDLDPNGTYLRKIIVAGDDITFVVNARLALALTEFFLRDVSAKSITVHSRENEHSRKGGYSREDGHSSGKESDLPGISYNISACAGIAFIHSHFPFSIGYEIAEACCKSAKERAKEERHCADGMIGNWLDFQLCSNVQLVSLSEYRKRYFRTAEGHSLLKRPYYVDFRPESMRTETQQEMKQAESQQEMNLKNSGYSLVAFKKDLAYFKSPRLKFPRSSLKNMRNTYILGEQAMQRLTAFEVSRLRPMPDGTQEAFAPDGCAKWYDALEMLDLYTDMEEYDEKAAEAEE